MSTTEKNADTVTASQLCEIANINPGTLRVWKSRLRESGIELLPESDDGWTRYTFMDAMRIMIIGRVAEMNTSALGTTPHILRQIALGTKYLTGFRNDIAYLIISTGMLGEIIPTTPRGSPGSKKGDGRKVYIPGTLYCDIVKGSELKETLADPDRYVSIVINLDEIENHIKEKWPDLNSQKSG